MKRSKFTEEQIVFVLRQQELGTSVEEVCLKMGVWQQTFYRWEKQYSGLGLGELRRLRQLEEENFRFFGLGHGIFEPWIDLDRIYF